MTDPEYGRCLAPHCKYWANRCKSNYCQPCCERIHIGAVWTWHPRPNGEMYKFTPGSHSALPVHYGGYDTKVPDKEIEDPAPPVVGAIEEVTDVGTTIIPVKDNSYFSPRGGASGFPIQYDK